MSWRTLLVLGGIGSGRSGFAESLLADLADTDDVRRVPAPAAGADLAGLAGTLAEAKPDEVLLVEDVAGWLPGGNAAAAGTRPPEVLAEAVRACRAARLVLVSAEVGLTLTPSAATSRNRVLALGSLNQALAGVVDAVALVVAGHPVWLKQGPVTGPTALATAADAAATIPVPDLSNLKALPTPDEAASGAVAARLAAAGTTRFGALAAVVNFAAGTQGRDHPSPWQQTRVLALHGDYAGGVAAGPSASARRAEQLRDGSGLLSQLAGQAGAAVQVVTTATAAPIEEGPAMTDEEAEQALASGWQLAEQAADEGIDAIVLASIGDGAEPAAAAVVSLLATNAEPASLLARVRTADGMIDDQAWIQRCAAIRDAARRVRATGRAAARPVLAELAGPGITTATGVILGAAARRTPVLLDGPLGAAAALAARGLASQTRHWCLLPDHNRHPTVVRASEVLDLAPLLDLQLQLGEGASCLLALPLLRSAVTLTGSLPGDV